MRQNLRCKGRHVKTETCFCQKILFQHGNSLRPEHMVLFIPADTVTNTAMARVSKYQVRAFVV
jgi:hypothetical protein